jgi:hypothetical protein
LIWIDQAFVSRQIGSPIRETDIGSIQRIGMGLAQGSEERFALSSGQLVLNSLRNESAAISFNAIDSFNEFGSEGYGDALLRAHALSMTLNMIILKRLTCHFDRERTVTATRDRVPFFVSVF